LNKIKYLEEDLAKSNKENFEKLKDFESKVSEKAEEVVRRKTEVL
jgi:hypothetical protein